MTHRERMLAVLRYKPYDRMPLVHFGFWRETLERWAGQGHLTIDEAQAWGDGNLVDQDLSRRLGFDFDYLSTFTPNTFLDPPFERQVLEEMDDGFIKVRNPEGVVVLEKAGVASIPSEIDHLLKTRKDWEEHYLPRLQFRIERITDAPVLANDRFVEWNDGGEGFLQRDERENWYGLHCGSLFGLIRNIAGLVGISYLWVDDEPLFCEIIDTVGELCYRCTEVTLAGGARFDFAHFWEDICFRGGPLIVPEVFAERVGPHYRRITDLVRQHGLDIVSVDCDGKVDDLIEPWLGNGVNTMFPIEVGTWDANIAPWRERYGRELRGVGGMDKRVLARDFAAVDAEIERLRPLVDLGGYVPCPDHRLAPDAEWDNVRYYCEKMRETFR